MRQLYWNGTEAIAFANDAKHFHKVSEDDAHLIFGNGKTVMRSVKPCREHPTGLAHIIGESGFNEWGEQFRYRDYFLFDEIK